MSLRQQLQQALENRALFSTGTETIEVAEAGQHLFCQLVALDTMACAFTRLTLRADTLAGRPIESLKKTAEQLSARLTYLLEPISPIETDAAGCVVQLRSNPPHKEADRTSYYELLVTRAGEISLYRYSRAAGQGRELIAAQVTREVLARLVDDFSAAATG